MLVGFPTMKPLTKFLIKNAILMVISFLTGYLSVTRGAIVTAVMWVIWVLAVIVFVLTEVNEKR